jgi:hypothetical protein
VGAAGDESLLIIVNSKLLSYEEEDTCHMRRRIHVESLLIIVNSKLLLIDNKTTNL